MTVFPEPFTSKLKVWWHGPEVPITLVQRRVTWVHVFRAILSNPMKPCLKKIKNKKFPNCIFLSSNTFKQVRKPL